MGWRYLSTLSLRIKYAAVSGAVVLLLSVGLTWSFIRQTNLLFVQKLEEEGLSRVEDLALDAVLVLRSRNVEDLNQLVEKAFVEANVSYVGFFDPEGTILASRLRGQRLRKIPPAVVQSARSAEGPVWITGEDLNRQTVYFFVTPIMGPDESTGQRLGAVVLGISSQFLQRDIQELVKVTIPIAIGALVVSCLLVFFLIARGLRPLSDMARLTSRIAHEDFSQRLEVYQQDEIGQLARDFNQMAEALQRRQAETERKNRELQALNAIATATSQALHLDDFFEIALGKVAEITGRDRVNIRAKDPVTGKVKLVPHQGFSQEEVEELIQRTPHKMSEQVFASGEPLIINGSSDIPPEGLLDRSRSVAWIPIKAGTKVVGVLGISDNQSVPFSPSEVELLLAIGNVIGVAMENARLFGETKRSLEGIRALHEIDMAITSTLDLRTVLDVMMEKIDLVLPYAATTVRLLNKESGAIEPVACRNLDEKEWKAEQWRGGRGIPNVVFETKAPLTISNVQTDPQCRDQEFFRKHGLVSYLGVPLIAKSEILGVISFYTKEEHEFNEEEIQFLSTLAGQAAIAIHNSRLYEETERRRGEAEALARVAQFLTETLDMTAVGERVVTSVHELFGVRASMLRLLQPDGSLRALASSSEGFSQDSAGDILPTGTGIASVAVAEGRPIWSADVLNEPRIRLTDQMRDYQLRSGNRSMIAVPLRAHEKIIGVLALMDQTGRTYSDSEVALVQTFADQAALALGNARLYEEMVKLAADLSRSNRVKDEFLSVMSHELRTPLNVVMGYTQMIRDGLLGEINLEQEKALEKVINRARNQLTMITSILQATQMEAEGVRVERREVGVRDFLDDLRSGYSMPLGKELSVIWDYPSDLPVVHTDVEKLKHVLQNLINNAIKFTEKGHVTISARPVEKRGGADGQGGRGDSPQHPSSSAPMLSFVEFKVADTGIGIAEEHFSVIFERFRQVDSSETRSYGGIGIGLYIVKKFTELLGGEVEVQSQLGKGSTFTVVIPCESYPLGARSRESVAHSSESV